MEGLAAFGTAVNVLTLIDMACKTISRIGEFTDRASEIPQSLRSTHLCLPLLADFLNRAKEQGLYDQNVVRDVLVEFNKQLEVLEKEGQKVLPLATDTRSRRWTKAVVSIRSEGRIKKAEQDVKKYQQHLTLWIVGSGYTAIGLAKMSTSKRVKFFNYDIWIDPIPQDPERYSSMYNEVATTLLLRRQEIMDTAVALAPNTYSLTASAYLMAQLGFEMQRADHA